MDPVSAIVPALVAGAAEAAKPTTVCAIGPWGGRRPRLRGEVVVVGAADTATVAGGR